MSVIGKALEQSTLITGGALLMFGGTACYLWATGQQVPNALLHLVWAVVGVFVGARVQKQGQTLSQTGTPLIQEK